MSVIDVTTNSCEDEVYEIVVNHDRLDSTPSMIVKEDDYVVMRDWESDDANFLNFKTGQQVEDFIKGIRKAQELGWLPKN